MAQTAHKTEEEKKEYFDPPEVLDNKVTMLAEMIINSSSMVAFTGAGISTACGIPDYRSGFNTVLETGPGCWETAANKQKYNEEQKKKGVQRQAPGKATLKTSIQKAYPSKTHMAMVELVERNHLKFVVSQNVDGLHRKSGIKPEFLAEVHGNTNLEVCESCGQEYMRDFRVRNAQKVHDHRTGRTCDNQVCRGHLKDTIINFGENLNENILELGFQNCMHADLCLTMGSSLRVTPAADMPKACAENGGNLVIVNLQKTPLDAYAALCIYAKIDDMMELLMQKLGYQIPSWQMKRRLKITHNEAKKSVSFMGVDSNGAPYELFTKVIVEDLQSKAVQFPDPSVKEKTGKKQRQPFNTKILNENVDSFKVRLGFLGHYSEPDLELKIEMGLLKEQGELEIMMVYDAGKTGNWDLVLASGANKEIIGVVEWKQKRQ